jgi:hypothetical protein
VLNNNHVLPLKRPPADGDCLRPLAELLLAVARRRRERTLKRMPPPDLVPSVVTSVATKMTTVATEMTTVATEVTPCRS